jgi:hypothetical protein
MSDCSDIPLYQYSSLEAPDAIQVLVLHCARNYRDPLNCDLVHQDRRRILKDTADHQYYEAVSYTWDNQDSSCPIFCNNRSSVLKVTPNVDSLLRYLRRISLARYLWIDAICLNQADSNEKSVQVMLMGNIYRQARKVRIWLGEANEDFLMVFFSPENTCWRWK